MSFVSDVNDCELCELAYKELIVKALEPSIKEKSLYCFEIELSALVLYLTHDLSTAFYAGIVPIGIMYPVWHICYAFDIGYDLCDRVLKKVF